MEPILFINDLFGSYGLILKGILMTVKISVQAIAYGTVAGLIIGIILEYGYVPLRYLFRFYVDFIRGIPVLVQILAAYYILSVIGVQLSTLGAGILALSVFCSSHVAEITRGALHAIPKGQIEAAKSVSLTFRKTVVYVLLPQALRQMLPTWVNTATEIVKASTLLSIIGVTELLMTIQQLISRTFLSLEFYFLAGFIYFLINFSIERIGKGIEAKVTIA